MRSLLLLSLLLAAPAFADEPRKVSYKKSVMLDPEYKSAWSDERIAKALEPPPPRVVVQYVDVERPVYVEPEYDYAPSWDVRWRWGHGWRRGYDVGWGPSYGWGRGPYYGYGRRSHRSTFPVFTILGEAAGGVIGHQSRETGVGIAIGAGVGLLADAIASR